MFSESQTLEEFASKTFNNEWSEPDAYDLNHTIDDFMNTYNYTVNEIATIKAGMAAGKSLYDVLER